MAFTTTPRLQLPTWTAPTDGPTRVEFNNGFLNLDNWAARDEQGTSGSRPTAGIRGRFYTATDTGVIYRDNGTSWTVVGSVLEGLVVNSSVTSAVTASFNAPSGQTADVIDAKVGATTIGSLSNVGDWTVGGALTGKRLALNNDNVANTIVYGRAAVSQSGDIVDIADNGGVNKYLNINSAGTLKSYYFYNDSAASVIGRTQISNANMQTFSGQPVMEVYSNKNGNAGTFREFLYLRHAGVSSSAVLRRMGVVMKIGEETTNDMARTGGIYIETSNANADNPILVLSRADAPVMQFSDTQAEVKTPLMVDGQVQIGPTALSQSIYFPFAGGSGMGYQTNNSIYTRAGTSGKHYWFYGGTHGATDGSPGVGGALLASLANNGGAGQFSTGNVTLSSQTDPVNGADTSSLVIGSDASGGHSLHIGPSTIIAKNDGSGGAGGGNPATLYLNRYGGNTYINRNGFSDEAGGGGVVGLPNSLQTKIGNRGFAIQYSQPSSPQLGDIWIAL